MLGSYSLVVLLGFFITSMQCYAYLVTNLGELKSPHAFYTDKKHESLILGKCESEPFDLESCNKESHGISFVYMKGALRTQLEGDLANVEKQIAAFDRQINAIKQLPNPSAEHQRQLLILRKKKSEIEIEQRKIQEKLGIVDDVLDAVRDPNLPTIVATKDIGYDTLFPELRPEVIRLIETFEEARKIPISTKIETFCGNTGTVQERIQDCENVLGEEYQVNGWNLVEKSAYGSYLIWQDQATHKLWLLLRPLYGYSGEGHNTLINPGFDAILAQVNHNKSICVIPNTSSNLVTRAQLPPPETALEATNNGLSSLFPNDWNHPPDRVGYKNNWQPFVPTSDFKKWVTKRTVTHYTTERRYIRELKWHQSRSYKVLSHGFVYTRSTGGYWEGGYDWVNVPYQEDVYDDNVAFKVVDPINQKVDTIRNYRFPSDYWAVMRACLISLPER